MGRTTVALVLAFLSTLIGGCATLAAPGPDWVPVNSKPAGAKVSLDGVAVGRTPLLLPFDRAGKGVLRFELPGYEPHTLDVDKVFNGWFAGNLLWAPLFPLIPVGVIVDLIAGSEGKYSTQPIRVELTPSSEPRTALDERR